MPMEPTLLNASTALQCSSLSDGVILRVAAGLEPLMSQPSIPNISESDSEEEYDPVSDSDSDFDPLDLIDDASEDEGSVYFEDQCESGGRKTISRFGVVFGCYPWEMFHLAWRMPIVSPVPKGHCDWNRISRHRKW